MLDDTAKREIRSARDRYDVLSTFVGLLKLAAVPDARRLRWELMVRSGSGTGS